MSVFLVELKEQQTWQKIVFLKIAFQTLEMAGSINLKDYFNDFEEKLLVKMPHQEEADITSATKLLEERREMAEVEQALIAQKEEFQMRMVRNIFEIKKEKKLQNFRFFWKFDGV